MPAALRPLCFVIVVAVTTFSVSGCIFPFTRGNDAKIEAVMQAAPETSAKTATPAATAKKELPPFAKFLGNMFTDDELAETPPTSPPTQSPAESVSPIVSAEAFTKPESAPDAKTMAPEPKASSREPLPVIVSPVEVTSSSEPDTPPDFDAADSRVARNAPSAATAPQQVAKSAPAVAPPEPTSTIPTEQLDEYSKSPWMSGQSLLQQAKRNSSENSTTLSHSLDLALENFRRENNGQPDLATQTQQTQELPASEPNVKALPLAETGHAPTDDGSENPLRAARGKTDWSGRALRPDAAPQTVLNATVESYPQTESQPLKWATSAPEASTASSEQAAKVAASTPQITVNPYADPVEANASHTPSPRMVNNTTVETAANRDQAESSTDAIHFQSSLLGKLQAANQRAAWDFTKAENAPQTSSGDSNVKLDTETSNDLPKIVDSSDTNPGLATPKQASGQGREVHKEPSITRNASAVAKSGADSSEASVLPANESSVAGEVAADPIQPFIIADPRMKHASPRGTTIRRALPAPIVADTPKSESSNTTSELPPVVRASEYRQPTSPSTSRGTKIYLIEGDNP